MYPLLYGNEAGTIHALSQTCGKCGIDGILTIRVFGAILITGKVMAVTVKAPDEPKVEYYEIVSGDTLSGIAKKYYGDPMQYPRLFEANREVIKDPDLIYPGQKIRIPLD